MRTLLVTVPVLVYGDTERDYTFAEKTIRDDPPYIGMAIAGDSGCFSARNKKTDKVVTRWKEVLKP